MMYKSMKNFEWYLNTAYSFYIKIDSIVQPLLLFSEINESMSVDITLSQPHPNVKVKFKDRWVQAMRKKSQILHHHNMQ